MDARAARAAENENLFRRINERVEALSERLETLTLVCECADPSCVERLAGVSTVESEAVRRHPDLRGRGIRARARARRHRDRGRRAPELRRRRQARRGRRGCAAGGSARGPNLAASRTAMQAPSRSELA